MMTTVGNARDVTTALPLKADFHVDPAGNDENLGTADAPFATLARARDAVRHKIRAGLGKDMLVLIGSGTYAQTETLRFGPEDSGTEKFSITYAAAPGATVVLSGGRKIGGWKKGAGSIWTAEIPEVKAGRWYFRQLFVNGVRATRARYPNSDAAEPWGKIVSSTARYEVEDQPIDVKFGGYKQPFKLPACKHSSDMELVYICNNDMGRKRVQSVDAENQAVTLPPPHQWNSKAHGNDWYLSFPNDYWKACFLENALELLDQPGEWYLDRESGVLSYWPRAGEDLTTDAVIAPAVQQTLLAVTGTRETPVCNLAFRGIHVEHLDWTPPAHGYMGLFCCTIDSGPKDHLQHGFIDAAVSFSYARSCHFTDGGIGHVGGMGLCLGRGTAGNSIEGNELCDVGAGGIGVSEIRQKPISERAWNTLPQAGDYTGYRIANNYIHHCGMDYFGAVGVTIFMMRNSVVSHNLIHDISYSGIQWAGDAPGEGLVTGDNTVEYNHIYDTMKVTADGAGMYVCYAHSGQTLIRGNLIHATHCNPYRRGECELDRSDRASHGLYLDSNMHGGRYEQNVVFQNAGGPLLFNADKNKSVWIDNLFQKDGTPPQEFIEAMSALAGLEPTYRKSLLKQVAIPCQHTVLHAESESDGWSAYQFDLPAKDFGVVEIFRRPECKQNGVLLRLRGLDAAARYELSDYFGILAKANEHFYDGTLKDEATRKNYLTTLSDLPVLSGVVPQPALRADVSGRELGEKGLSINLDGSSRVIWVVYRKVKP